MQITAIETIELADLDLDEVGWAGDDRQPHEQLLLVRIHSDTGHVGLGETYPHPTVDAEFIHSAIAPTLLESDPRPTERIWADCFRRANGYGGHAGSEMRSLSAIDMALWDLKGKALGIPVYELLGGKFRSSMPTYNTCYEREFSFLDQPVELAGALLDDGITAMKIWPYDPIALETDGQSITPQQLEVGAEPIRLIREEFGTAIDIAMEFHGLWNLSCAKRIAAHLEQYDPLWLEELLPIGDIRSYNDIGATTTTPLILTERLMNKYQFNQLIDMVQFDIVMFDVNRLGGFTEAKKVASIAEAHHLPIAPHNCGGPITHFASLQLGAVVPNLQIMESVRGRYDGWHRDMITEYSTVTDGRLVVPAGPGIGTELDRDFLNQSGLHRRVTGTIE